MTDACLSTIFVPIQKHVVNPVALILIDAPSTEKTTVLDFFQGLDMTIHLDKFTPASFLTQSASVKKKELKKVDLLPQLPYKTVLVPEMGPIFNQPKELLIESYALLARVLDGGGLSHAAGVHGRRTLTGDYFFCLLGATTPLNQTAWNTMGKIGSRLLFLSPSANATPTSKTDLATQMLTTEIPYREKRTRAKAAIRKFVEGVCNLVSVNPEKYQLPSDCPENLSSDVTIMKHCGYLPRVKEYDRSESDTDAVGWLAKLATFTTDARSDVRAWIEKSEDGKPTVSSSGVTIEGIRRYVSLLESICISHAWLQGRQGITMEDVPLAVQLSLSSLPDDRRKAIELLFDLSIEAKGTGIGLFNTSELHDYSGWSKQTCRQVMEKMQYCRIGHIEEGAGPIPTVFRLNEQLYKLFLTDTFQKMYKSWNGKGHADQSEIPF